MMRHPRNRSTREWIEEFAQELAASGVVDLIRRRTALLLATSALEAESFLPGASNEDLALRSSESIHARKRLLAAWVEAEAAKVDRSRPQQTPFRATGH